MQKFVLIALLGAVKADHEVEENYIGKIDFSYSYICKVNSDEDYVAGERGVENLYSDAC
jgi:hypothetical protein